MLDAALEGSYAESHFDESRLSALETKFSDYLSSCTLSAQNVTVEKDKIKQMISDISHQTKTPIANLLLYASLQSVSENQYEAARIDGAGFFQQFWYITLPNIKGSLALCALLRTIDTFRLFEKVNVLTGGGPAGTTTTITQFLYTYGIKSLDFGFGSAGAIVMTLLVLILSSFYIKRAMG